VVEALAVFQHQLCSARCLDVRRAGLVLVRIRVGLEDLVYRNRIAGDDSGPVADLRGRRDDARVVAGRAAASEKQRCRGEDRRDSR